MSVQVVRVQELSITANATTGLLAQMIAAQKLAACTLPITAYATTILAAQLIPA